MPGTAQTAIVVVGIDIGKKVFSMIMLALVPLVLLMKRSVAEKGTRTEGNEVRRATSTSPAE